MQGPSDLCATMKKIEVGCGYDERYDLIIYLWAHGVTLFPCEEHDRLTLPFCDLYNYSGKAAENIALTAALEKNQALFEGGLTAKEVKTKWR